MEEAGEGVHTYGIGATSLRTSSPAPTSKSFSAVVTSVTEAKSAGENPRRLSRERLSRELAGSHVVTARLLGAHAGEYP